MQKVTWIPGDGIGPEVTGAAGMREGERSGTPLSAAIFARLDLVSGSYGANAALHKLPYDTVTGIAPIILIGETGLIFTMHLTSPIKSIKEFIDAARAAPGKFNFGSAGAGRLGHLAGELFKLEAKVNITHVPYKGTGPVMSALLAAEVHTSFSSMVPAIPLIKSGRLRAIGITPPRRSLLLRAGTRKSRASWKPRPCRNGFSTKAWGPRRRAAGAVFQPHKVRCEEMEARGARGENSAGGVGGMIYSS